MSLAGSGGPLVVVVHVLGEPSSAGPSRSQPLRHDAGSEKRGESGVEPASPCQMLSPPFQPTLVRSEGFACLAAPAPCGPGWGRPGRRTVRWTRQERRDTAERERRVACRNKGPPPYEASIYLLYYSYMGLAPGIHRCRVQVVWGPKPGQSAREAIAIPPGTDGEAAESILARRLCGEQPLS